LKNIGKEKFSEWQQKLEENNVGSITFDFPGMSGSKGRLEDNNLENRIQITLDVVNWVSDNFEYEKLSIYGCSMGGYVVLGITDRSNKVNGDVILHVSAAYAKESHDINFNDAFTNVLKKENSWKNSLSFNWLENLNNRVFLIVHKGDEVIPQELSDTYKNIVSLKPDSKYIEISGPKHSIWGDGEEKYKYRIEVVERIIDFILRKS